LAVYKRPNKAFAYGKLNVYGLTGCTMGCAAAFFTHEACAFFSREGRKTVWTYFLDYATMIFGKSTAAVQPIRGIIEVNPIQPVYDQRRDLYKLYRLLNHMNLFGPGNLSSLLRLLYRYR
jgi:hypothetical protein